MSHFYGTVRGSRGEGTRCGAKSSGLTTYAAGWQGAIRTTLWYDEEKDADFFRVSLVPWQGSSGETRNLVTGELSSQVGEKQVIRSALGAIEFALQTLDQYNVRNHS